MDIRNWARTVDANLERGIRGFVCGSDGGKRSQGQWLVQRGSYDPQEGEKE